MITVEYKADPVETANATLDFIYNRPFTKIGFSLMRVACLLALTGILFKFQTNSIAYSDYFTGTFALLWLVGNRHLQKRLMRSILHIKKFDNWYYTFQATKYKIFWRINQGSKQQLPINKLRIIYKNKDGYIIPLTGVKHAAKFIWLPIRGFKSKQHEQQLLNMIPRIKLKTI